MLPSGNLFDDIADLIIIFVEISGLILILTLDVTHLSSIIFGVSVSTTS